MENFIVFADFDDRLVVCLDLGPNDDERRSEGVDGDLLELASTSFVHVARIECVVKYVIVGRSSTQKGHSDVMLGSFYSIQQNRITWFVHRALTYAFLAPLIFSIFFACEASATSRPEMDRNPCHTRPTTTTLQWKPRPLLVCSSKPSVFPSTYPPQQ
jgi:hypothetical protein